MQAPRQRPDAERLEVERASERASEQLGDAMHALREAVLATSRAGQWTASLDSQLCDRIVAFFAEAAADAPRKNCTKKTLNRALCGPLESTYDWLQDNQRTHHGPTWWGTRALQLCAMLCYAMQAILCYSTSRHMFLT